MQRAGGLGPGKVRAQLQRMMELGCSQGRGVAEGFIERYSLGLKKRG